MAASSRAPISPICETLCLPPTSHARGRNASISSVEVWVYTREEWLLRDPDGAHVAHEQRTVEFAPTVVAISRLTSIHRQDRRRQR